MRITTRLSLALCTLALSTTLASAAPVPVPKPPATTNLTGTELKFLKIQGLDPKAGVLANAGIRTETRYRTVPQKYSVTVIVQGKPRVEERTREVTVAQQVQVAYKFDTKTHNVYDGNGKLIPADRVFDRLAEGQMVLISSTAKLPKAYLDLLSPRAIIFVPKKDATPKRK